MTVQTSIPIHVRATLAIVIALSTPNFIGLLTKTKVWCAITGRCEIGGANYPDLVAGAVFNGLLLVVLFFIVLRRWRAYLMLFGATFVLAAALASVSFTTSSVGANQGLAMLDVLLLSSMLYVGCSLLTYGLQLTKTKRLADCVPAPEGG